MEVFNNYECENQISIFDLDNGPEKEKFVSGWKEDAMNPPVEPICKKASECEAYPIGCGGTLEPCRFGGPYKWSEKELDNVNTENTMPTRQDKTRQDKTRQDKTRQDKT